MFYLKHKYLQIICYLWLDNFLVVGSRHCFFEWRAYLWRATTRLYTRRRLAEHDHGSGTSARQTGRPCRRRHGVLLPGARRNARPKPLRRRKLDGRRRKTERRRRTVEYPRKTGPAKDENERYDSSRSGRDDENWPDANPRRPSRHTGAARRGVCDGTRYATTNRTTTTTTEKPHAAPDGKTYWTSSLARATGPTPNLRAPPTTRNSSSSGNRAHVRRCRRRRNGRGLATGRVRRAPVGSVRNYLDAFI